MKKTIKTKKGFMKRNFKNMRQFKLKYKPTKKRFKGAIIWTKKTRRKKQTKQKRKPEDRIAKQMAKTYSNIRSKPSITSVQTSFGVTNLKETTMPVDSTPDESYTKNVIYRQWFPEIASKDNILFQRVVTQDRIMFAGRISALLVFYDETGNKIGSLKMTDIMPYDVRIVKDDFWTFLNEIDIKDMSRFPKAVKKAADKHKGKTFKYHKEQIDQGTANPAHTQVSFSYA